MSKRLFLQSLLGKMEADLDPSAAMGYHQGRKALHPRAPGYGHRSCGQDRVVPKVPTKSKLPAQLVCRAGYAAPAP